MSTDLFQVGKLPLELLQSLLARYAQKDERLVVGAQIGEDAAVIDMGDRYLVAKSDPITFATGEIGWYVVHVNANDLATMGATPHWFLLTLLLPDSRTDRTMVEEIFAQVSEACQALDIVLCGGHTEITYGLDRPIAVGLMLGEVDRGDLIRTGGAQVGDHVILTKGIAIEGTAVLAIEAPDRLAPHVNNDMLERGRRFLKEPGISVMRDAQVVVRAGKPHAMHDPTEGGLATGLWELAYASEKGIVVDREKIHIFPETAAFCKVLDLDPVGLIASGALLIAASPDKSALMVRALSDEGISASVIGEVVDGPAAVQIRTKQGLESLPIFQQDELSRVFGTAV